MTIFTIMVVDPKKKKYKFNVNAYKHAIGMVESSGGKNLESSTSSASGRYQFLYNSIKHDSDMEGVTKRQFINNPELQELIMDKALNGKLKGYTYGTGYAERLKGDYNTEHDIGELTALVHFLGPGNTRKYLKDPTTFKVPGRNASPQAYVDRFKGYINEYKKDNPKEFVSELAPAPLEGGKEFSAPQIQDERFEQKVVQDNTNVQQPARQMVMEPEGTPASRLANMFNMGGYAGGEDASEQVIQFEGGGSHEQNPNGGIKIGMGSNGKPNLVEEGETKWNDYIFSNSIDLDGNFSLGETSGNVFAKGGMLKRADGSYSKRGLWDNIRAAKGSGRKPTAAMLKQERKINSKAEGGNLFAEGGNLTDPIVPTDPVGTKPTPGDTTAAMVGPKTEIESNIGVNDKTKFGYLRPDPEGHKSTLREPSSILKENSWQSMGPITGDSSKYKNDSILSTQEGMDLSSLNNSPGANSFMNTYNNPKTKAMMLAQTDLTSEQYDNMVVQGMEPEVVVGGNDYGSAAQYKNGNVHMGEDHVGNAPMETHERAHASKFDVIQQANIKRALGSSFKQEKDAKKGYNYKKYIDQPHEQYGNFAEFREKLGLQPGADISPEDLEILVKKKGLEKNVFYKHYDNKNIANALKTVAYQNNNSNQEYRIS